MLVALVVTEGHAEASSLGLHLGLWWLKGYAAIQGPCCHGAMPVWVVYTTTWVHGDIQAPVAAEGQVWVHGPASMGFVLISSCPYCHERPYARSSLWQVSVTMPPWGQADLNCQLGQVSSVPGLLKRAISGSLTLPRPGSLLMSMVPDIIDHANARGLDHHLGPLVPKGHAARVGLGGMRMWVACSTMVKFKPRALPRSMSGCVVLPQPRSRGD